jgi:hypothetical protein
MIAFKQIKTICSAINPVAFQFGTNLRDSGGVIFSCIHLTCYMDGSDAVVVSMFCREHILELRLAKYYIATASLWLPQFGTVAPKRP